MNYAWEAALAAEKQGITREKLRFCQAESVSPYIELAFENLNTTELQNPVVALNVLCRYSHVFSRMLDINLEEYTQLREALLDVMVHLFVQCDLREGLSRDEYYIRFMLRDILNGVLGEEYRSAVEEFTAAELKKILFCMLTMYRTGTSLLLFRKAMRAVFPESIVYSDNDAFRELLIYIGVKETEHERKKINFLTTVFLNLNYEIHLFWEHHFGIIDVEETLYFDDMVIF